MKNSYRRRQPASRLERLFARIVTNPHSTRPAPRVDLAHDSEVDLELT
jgi:hypothetical protein